MFDLKALKQLLLGSMDCHADGLRRMGVFHAPIEEYNERSGDVGVIAFASDLDRCLIWGGSSDDIPISNLGCILWISGSGFYVADGGALACGLGSLSVRLHSLPFSRDLI